MKQLLSALLILTLLAIAGCSNGDQQIESASTDTEVNASEPKQKQNQGADEVEVEESEEQEAPGTEEKTSSLEGNWSRNILNYTGELTITKATEERFHFTLNVIAGGNVGDMDGEAMISGDTATYKTSESDCELTFHLSEDVITIEQTEGCMTWGGVGTSFDGEYERGDVKIDTNLHKEGLLSESEDQLFRSVVGDDYELYLSNLNLVFEGEDKDGLNTKVKEGFVRGLASAVGGIIMINDDYVYAAVTDSDAIRYHSNDPEYKGELPLTIREWVDKMIEDEVVMESE